ncbi:hypothetical protein JW859_14270 [bacterium]|nr:hypothetical protein [bacterium]
MRFLIKYTITLISFLLVVLACAACGGGSSRPEIDNPTISPTPRGASDIDIDTDGTDYTEIFGGNTGPGTKWPKSLVIAPGGDDDLDIAWAKYAIPDLSQYRPVTASFAVDTVIAPGGDDDLPLLYWVGVFNYSQSCWDWHGPFDSDTELTLNSSQERDRYISATDVMNLIVLTDCSGIEPTAGNPDGLCGVELGYSTTVASEDYYSLAPCYPEITSIHLGGKGVSDLDPETQYVTLEWVHVTDSDDSENEVNWYKVYRKLSTEAGVPQLLKTVQAPASAFTDPVDDPNKNRAPVPGATYLYFLQSHNGVGVSSMVPAEPITVPFYPPTDVSATDGDYTDKVVVTWTEAEGAEGYQIFRNGLAEPLAEVGDVDSWEDTSAVPGILYMYSVKSVNEYAVSEDASTADEGYCGAAG